MNISPASDSLDQIGFPEVWGSADCTHYDGVQALTSHLIGSFDARRSLSVTWLNHHSASIAFRRSATELHDFDVVGVDGKLLQLILGGRHRTSADLVVPALLPQLQGARVVVVGGPPDTLHARTTAVEAMLSEGSTGVRSFDGFDGLPDRDSFARSVAESRANLVLIGLGAGLQEQYATCAKAAFTEGGIALTCGGLLDQLLCQRYYPPWAYPLRLNWLVRLSREPRRLWRRYTVQAARAVIDADALREAATSLPGLWV